MLARRDAGVKPEVLSGEVDTRVPERTAEIGLR
jgi:hypothetical protein